MLRRDETKRDSRKRNKKNYLKFVSRMGWLLTSSLSLQSTTAPPAPSPPPTFISRSSLFHRITRLPAEPSFWGRRIHFFLSLYTIAPIPQMSFVPSLFRPPSIHLALRSSILHPPSSVIWPSWVVGGLGFGKIFAPRNIRLDNSAIPPRPRSVQQGTRRRI